MKVVLDTNVLIAALITKGVCSELLERCVLRHEIVLSESILAETKDRLVGKFRYSDAEADEAVDLFRSEVCLVAPTPLAAPVCRDPDDDVILGTAVAGQAKCIVTGDKDLLVLKRFQGIEIVSPSEFAEFEMRDSDG